MGGFLDKAREMAEQHDEQVDQALEKTGGKYDDKIGQGKDWAQEHTGDGDTQP